MLAIFTSSMPPSSPPMARARVRLVGAQRYTQKVLCFSVLAEFDVVYPPLVTSYGSCSGAPAESTILHP